MIKLFRFLKPFRWWVAAVFTLVLLTTLCELYLPTLMADIVDKGIINGDIGYIIRIGGLMLVIAALGTVFSMAVSFLAARNAVGLGKILRQQVFSKVECFSLQEMDRFGTATLITRTTNDINQVQTVTFMMQRMMLMAPVMCVGGIIMAVSQDRPLSLTFAAAVPVLAVIIVLIMSKAIPLFRLMQLKIDKMNLVVREGLTGIRVIRAFNGTERESVRFREANADLMQNAIKVNRLIATLMPTMMLVMNFTIIAIIWFGSVRIDLGRMQVGSLMAFIQYSIQIMISLIMVSFIFIMLPRASASADRINEVLNTVPNIQDSRDSINNGLFKGRIEFREVTFSFPGAEAPALNNVSFTAYPGQITAIIGGTGSGKSALMNLIPRFYDVDQGAVLIDGTDVRQIDQAALRSKIGLVPQKTVLFTGTIADNIRYGKIDASDEEVRMAAETAQALEFIDQMKDGFASVIEQGGTNVSGGQKQRLAIARALVRGGAIYLFDDSFSALDYKTEVRLRLALKQRTGKAAVLIVAQRAASVMDADKIIVLEDGRIVGTGNHKELMDACEVYREIVYSQLDREELA